MQLQTGRGINPGERSPVIYTLLGSGRRLGVNPFDYLKDLFTRLAAARITDIKPFTPAAWAKATAENIKANMSGARRWLDRIKLTDHARSKRSRFITLFQAATKSWTNFFSASELP